MQVVHGRCCGLDVQKRSVVACALTPGERGGVAREVRTFGTMTADLLALATWLSERAVTHVAMESTGVYWQPVWNILEGSFELLLVNAHHVKTVPGRKTDVKDSEWLADLLRHGLLRASFVPERPQRELRELTRYRTTVIRQRSAEVNRLQKTLEGANIKLAAVASDVLGVSARQRLEGLVAGTTDAAALAQVARGKLRQKRPQLEQALTGRFGAHQRFLIAQQLAHVDYLDDAIAQLDAQITDRLRPFEPALGHLDAIPGVGRRTAEVLLAEIGTDMTRFPSAAHLASWAGLCPGHDQSAGKRRSGKTRHGDVWLRAALIEAAHAASRTKATALSRRYHRLVVRRGRKKAIVALAHQILTLAYHLLAEGVPYEEAAARPLPEQRQPTSDRLVRELEALGYKVTLEPAA